MHHWVYPELQGETPFDINGLTAPKLAYDVGVNKVLQYLFAMNVGIKYCMDVGTLERIVRSRMANTRTYGKGRVLRSISRFISIRLFFPYVSCSRLLV